MAREFAYAFETITRLPPERAVEFWIDLVPEAEPISRPPSRMIPTEVKELKVQLVDLKGWNFTRPNILASYLVNQFIPKMMPKSTKSKTYKLHANL